MKRLIFIAAVVLAALTSTPVKAADTYFPYPIVPDSITSLQGRTTFLVQHFWDMCDLKKAFSSRAKMAGALQDYLSFTPYASARDVHKSIAIFLKKIEKQPDDVLFVARTAEAYIHSDTAQIFSDELFLPFARAVAENKRIDKEGRKHFEQQTNVLTATMLNTRTPDITYTDRNGNTATYVPDSTQVTILFFNDPTDPNTALVRARLNADIKATEYVDTDVMKIVSISTMAPGAEWQKAAESFPEKWVVGTNPGIGDIYDIRFTPCFYIVDQAGNILLKNSEVNRILSIISNL